MRKENKALKWITAGILYLSAIFFFLPYHNIDIAGLGELFDKAPTFTPIQIMRIASTANEVASALGGETVQTGIFIWGSILFYIVPVVLVITAAVLLSLKFGKGKYITAICLNAVSVILYIIYFINIQKMGSAIIGSFGDSGLGSLLTDVVQFGISFALIANVVIASLGVILPLFNITATAETQGSTTSLQRQHNTNNGVIHCISGAYQGADFVIADNEELILGRDGSLAQVVFQNAPKVSRKHCGIRYDKNRSCYEITDYSANGTFVVGGSRLVANRSTDLSSGTMIYLGNKDNQFRLI